MGIQHCSEHAIVMDLPRELKEHPAALQTAIDAVRGRGDRDVVVDFSRVEVVGSPTFSRLLELRTLLRESGRRLVLCGVAGVTRRVFSVAQLEELFEFTENQSAALAGLESPR